MHTTISLLLPTYGRPAELRRTLADLVATVARPALLDVVVYAVGDDRDTLAVIAEAARSSPFAVELTVGPHLGYRGLPTAINTAARFAGGSWLFVFADDVGCDTTGWDDVIRSYDHTVPTLLTCDNDRHNPAWFPVISRPAYEAMGLVTASQFHDVWLGAVFGAAGCTEVHRAIPAHFTDRLVHTDGLSRLSDAERLAYDQSIADAAARLAAARRIPCTASN